MTASSERLSRTFAQLKTRGETGLFPYLTAGFPDVETCGSLVDVMLSTGADGLELGLPFSDPLADGVTLQRANAQALERGASIETALRLAQTARAAHQAPITLMSYVNPILAYGVEELCRAASAAGLDGLIVPDLPLQEAERFAAACRENALDYIYMVAPTSEGERLAEVGRRASGFVYCVALLGTTGARSGLSNELPGFLASVRQAVSVPLVAGLGISTPRQVADLVGQVDGVIVGSALADLIDRTDRADVGQAVGRFVRELKEAAQPSDQATSTWS